MKKWLVFMCGCVLVGCVASASSSSAPWVVYDYKANIKRPDNKLTSVKYSIDVQDQKTNATLLWDSYTTAIDDLKGYLLVPNCVGCEENASLGSVPYGKQSWIYIIRKADKLKNLWKFKSIVGAGLFNVGVTSRPSSDDIAYGPTSMKKLTQAWMSLQFDFFNPSSANGNLSMVAAHGKYSPRPYGFLGHGSSNSVAQPGYVCNEELFPPMPVTHTGITHTGFGTAKLLDETQIDWCSDPDVLRCMIISGIEGRMTGLVVTKPVCDVVVMWDVCRLLPEDRTVIFGGWSIKLNNKLTKAVNALAVFDVEEIEVPVLDEDGNVVMIPELDEDGNPIPVLDEDGNTIPVLDEDGNPIPVLDEDGNPVLVLDENGDPIQAVDENGDPIVDEFGEPVYEVVVEVEVEMVPEVELVDVLTTDMDDIDSYLRVRAKASAVIQNEFESTVW